MIDKALRAVDYLNHILQAIERIERYTADMTEHTFLASELTQDAVIRNFEIIGEASRNIDRNCPEFAAAHPDLPLLNAYEMRNALAHGYFRGPNIHLVFQRGKTIPSFRYGLVLCRRFKFYGLSILALHNTAKAQINSPTVRIDAIDVA